MDDEKENFKTMSYSKDPLSQHPNFTGVSNNNNQNQINNAQPQLKGEFYHQTNKEMSADNTFNQEITDLNISDNLIDFNNTNDFNKIVGGLQEDPNFHNRKNQQQDNDTSSTNKRL